MIFRVGLEMFGEVVDALAEKRDLYLGGSGICVVGLVRSDDFGFPVFGKRHAVLHVRPRFRSVILRSSPPLLSRLGITIPSDSTFYTRTITGCKRPPGRVSAIPIRRPAASSRRRRVRVAPETGVAGSGSETRAPWRARSRSRSFSTPAGISGSSRSRG